MAFGPLSRRQFLHNATAGSAMAATSSDRPNISFLMADEHRYDALNRLGNSTVHSPNLNRMACQGVRFTHTYRQGPPDGTGLENSYRSREDRIICSEWNQAERWSGPSLVNPDATNYDCIEKSKGCAWVRWIQ